MIAMIVCWVVLFVNLVVLLGLVVFDCCGLSLFCCASYWCWVGSRWFGRFSL